MWAVRSALLSASQWVAMMVDQWAVRWADLTARQKAATKVVMRDSLSAGKKVAPSVELKVGLWVVTMAVM